MGEACVALLCGGSVFSDKALKRLRECHCMLVSVPPILQKQLPEHALNGVY